MFLLLLLLWIVFNGRVTVEIVIFGILIASAVSLFACRFLGYSFKREFAVLKCLPDFLLYLLILIVEIIKANFVLVGMIFKGSKALTPAICHFHTKLKSNIARTILADSITLTPGTITVSMRDDEFYVHCLDKSLADGITTSVFVKRLERMEAKLNGTNT
ncbi:MAG: Na+/H+ antiporter subunit E [Lachnospiraceae bacterium]|nr:Na+/H+ antiporter subunit E [Lachnospiraceae bacterium]